MSADKHRSLARRIAWLRYFSGAGTDGSLTARRRATGIKGCPHVTVDVLRLEHDGLLTRSRTPIGWFGKNGTATSFEATQSGLSVLQDELQRRGQDFGPVSLVRSTQADRPNKDERARRRLLSWQLGFNGHNRGLSA